MAGFLKIIFKQTQTKSDINEMNIKFGVEEKMDLTCSCGGEDNVIHRLFHCENFSEKCRILKLKIGDRWKNFSSNGLSVYVWWCKRFSLCYKECTFAL